MIFAMYGKWGAREVDKRRVCCFTGHRQIAAAEMPRLLRRLEETIESLIGRGILYFGSGAALGFDTLAVNAVLRQRAKNSKVKLIMVLPCRNQDLRWRENDREEYRRLIEEADKVVCLSEKYYDGCMRERNRHLVEHSGVCVAYMKYGGSGAAQTVRFARERELAIINLA